MLVERPWVPQASEHYVQELARRFARQSPQQNAADLLAFVDENRQIHERDCINLNPGTNVMNPQAEALLAMGVGRPSLGYPGEKYEMGLEGVEKIEVLAAELAAEVFDARYAEIRVASGQLANFYAYLATTQPGDKIFVPGPEIGGHASHQTFGVAGLYHLAIHIMPHDAAHYTVDLDALRKQALQERPKVIVLGGSLNLFTHPVREVRAIADEIGAVVLFDAAHISGLIAGHAWQNPLQEGAHLIAMSTYKSLGGPIGGLIVTNDAKLAHKLDVIAYPGITANFDASKSAALAMSLLDWRVYGKTYADEMVESARALGSALVAEGLPVFARDRGITTSHQFAIEATEFGGGQHMAKLLRRANLLTCGIGLPLQKVENDLNGLRLGTPEIVRWGMRANDMPGLARLIADALLQRRAPEVVAKDVKDMRGRYSSVHYTL